MTFGPSTGPTLVDGWWRCKTPYRPHGGLPRAGLGPGERRHQIGRYSPETFEAEWLEGATGPAVGAKFRGHVKRNGKGPIYWTTCTVTECVPGRTFAFGVGPAEKPLNVWRYRLEPTATAPMSPSRSSWPRPRHSASTGRCSGWTRGRTNRNGMRTTLERIKAEVE